MSLSRVLVTFQQQMYTMVTPPTSVPAFFADHVTATDLAPFVGPPPPAYISSATYGRRTPNVSRTRYHYADDLRSRLMGGTLLIEPISFVMERKMLRVIKALVESPPH